MNLREHVPLGRTGMTVSRLGIASGYGVPTHAIEKAFREHNVNYFYIVFPKRAKMYRAIRNLGPTEREKLVLVLGTPRRTGLFLQSFIENSMKKCGVDYFDVLKLGWHNSPPRKSLIDQALNLKQQGKIRFLAMSGHHRPLFGQMARGEVDLPIDIYQIRYNAVHAGAEQDIFPHLPAENRPGIVIYTATCWRKLLEQKNMPRGEAAFSAADCYRFVLTNPNVDVCITGPSNAQHMDHALTALDAGPMSDEEMARARRIGDHVSGKKRT